MTALIHNTNSTRTVRVLVFVLTLLVPGLASAQAEPPRVFLDTTYDTTYSDPTARTTWTVSNGCELQNALDAALPGDVIELTAGTMFLPCPPAGSFTLRHKAGTAWIYIRPTAGTQLPPPGTRVIPCSVPTPSAPCNAAEMPTIQATDDRPAIVTEPGAHRYRLVGIEVATAPGIPMDNLISLGTGNEVVDAALPHDLIIDRCYVHGEPNVAAKRGIALNSKSTAVIDSYVVDFKRFDTDLQAAESQAIGGWNGPGPFKIANNYIEGAGENLMFGGADPKIPSLVPSDIDIRGNYFYKPQAWKGVWTVRHLFELKNAQRVLVEGNVFQNNWEDSDHTGAGIAFTARNQDGTAPWSTVEDVTFQHNVLKCSGAGIGIHGADDGTLHPSQPTERLVIRNNILDQIYSVSPATDANCTAASGTGRLYQIVTRVPPAPNFVTIDHNTGFADGALLFAVGVPGSGEGFAYTNNVAPKGRSGVTGLSSTGATDEGRSTLDTFFPGHVFTSNVIQREDGDCASYPPGNFCPATWAEVGFVDQANGNYRLAPGSPYKNLASDGQDIGANIDAVETFTAGAVSGAFHPPSPAVWTNPVNVTVNGNSIEKTGGCDTCDDAGAISAQQIPAGNGYVAFTIPLTTKQLFAGLSTADVGASRWEIDFGLKFIPGGIVEVRENNIYQAETTFEANDVFRVTVADGQVRYSRNGLAFHTSAKLPLYPLLLDTSLQDLNATIADAVILATF